MVGALPGAASDLAIGPDGVLYAAAEDSPHHEVVVRFDPTSKSLTQSASLPGSATRQDELAVSGGLVWVAGQDPSDPEAARSAFGLDARNLALRASIPMPAPPVAAAAVAAGVWFAAGHELVLIDPATSHVIRTAPAGGRVTLMGADPTGNQLYVATDTPSGQHDSSVFVEMSALTGVTLATQGVGFEELGGPSGLAPTTSGVWVAIPSGMQGGLNLLRTSDLHPTSSGTFEGIHSGFINGSNGIRGSFARDLLWVSTDPTAPVECANPSTGAFRGRVAIPRQSLVTSDVVSNASGIYMALTHERAALGSQLMRIVPPPACRPR